MKISSMINQYKDLYTEKYGNITSERTLRSNLRQNCIPEMIFEARYKDYELFLEERRKLMAGKIENYYKSL